MPIKTHLRRWARRKILDVLHKYACGLPPRPPCIWDLSRHPKSVLVLLVIFFFPLLAYSFPVIEQDRLSVSLGGYYKNLFFTSKRQATGQNFIADLNRLRLDGEAMLGERFTARAAWDYELIGGDYVATEEFATRQTNRNIAYPDMEYELARSSRWFYGQNFYRAYLNYKAPRIDATVGRQRIDWGVMRIDPVADLFVRPPVFDLEKDEFIAPTAVNLVVPIGPALRINPVYTLASDFDRSRTGARLTGTIWRFDLSGFGGRFLQDTIAGLDFEGDVWEIGVRGEFLHDWAGQGGDFIQGAVGFDYGFPNSLYLAAEYFFNGQGTGDRATALPFPQTAPFLQTIYENFVGLEVKYDLTPLWNLLVIVQNDLQGGSVLINPETSYSLFSWLELQGGAIVGGGNDVGEFGPVPNAYYGQAQAFF